MCNKNVGRVQNTIYSGHLRNKIAAEFYLFVRKQNGRDSRMLYILSSMSLRWVGVALRAAYGLRATTS